MNVGIIGLGNMGGAIAGKLSGKFSLMLFDKSKAKLKKNRKATVYTKFDAVKKCDYLIIAVKPQDVPALAKTVKHLIKPSCVVISIAAGLTINGLKKMFAHSKIVRVMPSMTLSVGQGIAFWKASRLSPANNKQTKKILNTFTENFEVKTENLIDAGSIIYGSGPAYFFLLAAALENAAKNLGIQKDKRRMLVEKTFLGSALLQEKHDYDNLIKKIASKKGITEAALKVFKQKNFTKIVNEAVKAGFKRTKELSKK